MPEVDAGSPDPAGSGRATPDVASTELPVPDAVTSSSTSRPAVSDLASPDRVAPDVASSEVTVPDAATRLFGDRQALARRYAEHLRTTGVEHGLIGPREAPRIWDRHILNCAVVADALPDDARVVDIGSGAGLPGIPLALARPDLEIVLVEPLHRRVDWLRMVIDDLGLAVELERGRAEEPAVRRRWEGADVVTARAVAPLHRLAGWALPLLRTGGRLVAVKGASAAEEIERDAAAMASLGVGVPRIQLCGVGVVEPPTTVIVVERASRRRRR